MKFLKTFALLTILAMGGIACTPTTTTYVDDSYYGWYDQWGYECGNLAPGCNYWFPTGDWSDKINMEEDPYYYSSGYGDFEYYDYYSSYRDVWVSRTGIIYDSWDGQALNKDSAFATGRDVVTDVALAEEKALEAAGVYYARKFGLAEDQGMKLAKTLNDFSTLQERSEQDIADFTKRLYGVDFNGLKPALDSAAMGNNSKLETVITDAAVGFGTTPENMRGMIKSLHGKLLKEAGISLD